MISRKLKIGLIVGGVITAILVVIGIVLGVTLGGKKGKPVVVQDTTLDPNIGSTNMVPLNELTVIEMYDGFNTASKKELKSGDRGTFSSIEGPYVRLRVPPRLFIKTWFTAEPAKYAVYTNKEVWVDKVKNYEVTSTAPPPPAEPTATPPAAPRT